MTDTSEIARIAAGLSEAQRAIIFEMSGDIGFTAARLSGFTHLAIVKVRKAQRGLHAMGLASLVPLFNEADGLLMGRGYVLEDNAYELRAYLEKQRCQS